MRRNDALPLGVLDVETSWIRAGRAPVTRFWGLATERGYQRFETTTAMVAALGAMPRHRLYFHHDFDVCQLIADRVVPETLQVRGVRVVRCQLAGHDLVNSYALFPAPLKAILAACGYTKRPLGAEGHRPDCACRDCADALAERNRSDCVEGLASFRALGDSYADATGTHPLDGGFSTAAGAAFAAATEHAGELPVYLDNREAFRGGRAEAFRLDRHPVEAECWDINSSYPASFLECPDADWLMRVRVRVPRGHDGPLPFFARERPGLIFPAGRFSTWCYASNWERYYSKMPGVEIEQVDWKRPVDFSWMRRVAPLLRKIYALRMVAANPATKFALKIFINSIYGRLGLRAGRTVVTRSEALPTWKNFGAWKHPDGGYLVFSERHARPKANYAFAAWVTDNARARLFQALHQSEALYCDTDSVYCRPGSFPAVLPQSPEMGAWKFEGSGGFRARTVKDYEFAGKVVRKGGAGGKGATVWTIKLALDRKGVKGVKEKKRRTRYSKRRVRADGSTSPLVL